MHKGEQQNRITANNLWSLCAYHTGYDTQLDFSSQCSATQVITEKSKAVRGNGRPGFSDSADDSSRRRKKTVCAKILMRC